MWWDYIKAILMIVIVIAAAFYLTKFVASKSSGSGAKGSPVRITGSRALGKDKHIAIAEIGKKVYILGITAQSINVLDTFPAEEFHSAQTQEGEQTAKPKTGAFAEEFLERLKGTYKNQ